jgi:hypothetical protein
MLGVLFATFVPKQPRGGDCAEGSAKRSEKKDWR